MLLQGWERAALGRIPRSGAEGNGCLVHSGTAALPDGLADEILLQLEALPAERAQGIFLWLVLPNKHGLKGTRTEKPAQLAQTSQQRRTWCVSSITRPGGMVQPESLNHWAQITVTTSKIICRPCILCNTIYL